MSKVFCLKFNLGIVIINRRIGHSFHGQRLAAS